MTGYVIPQLMHRPIKRSGTKQPVSDLGISSVCYNDAIELRAICVAVLITATSTCLAAAEDDCGFAELNPVKVSPDSVARNAWWDQRTNWAVTPLYPREAREKGISGAVRIRVLIDAAGKVVKTCPVSWPDEDIGRTLVQAATTFIYKGRFRPNFGLAANRRAASQYGETTLEFNFRSMTAEKPSARTP